MRQIVLDTETTGLETRDGHRIIELGCVELVNRRLTGNNLHLYFQPDREIDEEAISVHGITNEFLADKTRFADEVGRILNYLKDAELIIHNAAFDIGFLNYELSLIAQKELGKITDYCTVLDSLAMARSMHPGQRNSLDALCKRYDINNAHRELHGALLDAEILADVYLAMTSGQEDLLFEDSSQEGGNHSRKKVLSQPVTVKAVALTEEEHNAHQEILALLEKTSGQAAKWTQLGWS